MKTESGKRFQQAVMPTVFVWVLVALSASLVFTPGFGQRSSEEIESRDGGQALSQAQRWALACPALLSENNQERHDLLFCYDPSPQSTAHTRKLLAEWWDIKSHDDVLKKLDWLAGGGQRVEFDRIVKVQNAPKGVVRDTYVNVLKKQYGEAEFNRKWNYVQKYKEQLGAKSLIAWDLCRIVSISRWAVLCDYLSEDEAWSRIMPAAKKLQRTFSSWDDLGTNYMIGRNFWRADVSSYDSIKQKLLTDSSSPWKRIPWNTPL